MTAAVAALVTATPAFATDEYFELWFNPSVSVALDKKTDVEFETAQRFRSRSDGGRDTYFFRLWLNREIAKGMTISGGVEQRFNENLQEQRLHQQLYIKSGILRLRSRLEERFVDGEDRMALRFRQRIGVAVPLSKKWTIGANGEGFFTLRTGNRNARGGLTSLRTTVDVARKVSDKLTVSLGYLRAQDVRIGRADRVGHAPLLGLDLTL